MKKLIYLSLFVIIAFISCENNQDFENSDTFNYEKTDVSINDKITIVNTDNINLDFKNTNLFLHKNVEIINGLIRSKNNLNLWYIPFDKNEEPILIGKRQELGDITISCDCSVAQVNTCDVEEETSGGTTTFTCNNGCFEGSCDMTVTVESKTINISTGIIVSSNKITFNNKKYK